MSASLREATVTFRDEKYVVRELTFVERLLVAAAMGGDVQKALILQVSLGTVDPKMTEEEVETQPAALIEALLIRIAQLCQEKRRWTVTEKINTDREAP